MTTVAVPNAWGARTTTQAISLNDIMGEQRASQLAPQPIAEEESNQFWACSACTLHNSLMALSCTVCGTRKPTAEEIEAAAALKAVAKAEENAAAAEAAGGAAEGKDEDGTEPPAAADSNPAPANDTTDSDMALALQLAEEEDRRYEQFALQRQKEQGSKVRLGFGYQPLRRRRLPDEEEDEDDYGDAGAREVAALASRGSGGGLRSVTKHDRLLCGRRNARSLQRFHGAGDMDGRGMRVVVGNKAFNGLKEHFRRRTRKGVSVTGGVEAAATATRGAVMDAHTRLLLLKMINAGALEGVRGVLRSGKEASVFGGRGRLDWQSWQGLQQPLPPSPAPADAAAAATSPSTVEEDEAEAAAVAAGEAAAAAEIESWEVVREDDERRAAAASAASTSTGAAGTAEEEEEEEEEEELGALVDDGEQKGMEEEEVAAAVTARVLRQDDECSVGEEEEGEREAEAEGECGEVAIKIFRVALNEFKQRAEYVAGDHRFAHRSFNPAKLRRSLQLWAEKEMKNLTRLHRAGIPCPRPLALREHVLVMTLVQGDDSGNSSAGGQQQAEAAPQLRDARLSRREAGRAYLQCCLLLRAMYQRAGLVHADFSEYNVLYAATTEDTATTGQQQQQQRGRRRCVVIDVGQAVTVSHPRAREYLLRDCASITAFFRRAHRQRRALKPSLLMRFVMDPHPFATGDSGSSSEEEEEEEEEWTDVTSSDAAIAAAAATAASANGSDAAAASSPPPLSSHSDRVAEAKALVALLKDLMAEPQNVVGNGTAAMEEAVSRELDTIRQRDAWRLTLNRRSWAVAPASPPNDSGML